MPDPPPFIFVPPTPLFQWVRLGLEARGPSAAARISWARAGGPSAAATAREGRRTKMKGGPKIQYWENPVTMLAASRMIELSIVLLFRISNCFDRAPLCAKLESCRKAHFMSFVHAKTTFGRPKSYTKTMLYHCISDTRLLVLYKPI